MTKVSWLASAKSDSGTPRFRSVRHTLGACSANTCANAGETGVAAGASWSRALVLDTRPLTSPPCVLVRPQRSQAVADTPTMPGTSGVLSARRVDSLRRQDNANAHLMEKSWDSYADAHR